MVHKKNVLVIGDVMLDTYYIGDVIRISPEAPVPVLRKNSEYSVLGGAANVAANLVAAGQNVAMMSIVGKDKTSEKLKSLFETQGINIDLIVSLDRHTTEKTRFLASNNQQILRLDVEDTNPISNDDCYKMLDILRHNMAGIDLILISDYMKGLLTYDFTQGIIQIAKENSIPTIIDVKDPKCEKYYHATLLKPNLKELRDLTGINAETDDEIIQATLKLRAECQCNYVLTTCGGRGMVLVGDGEPYFIDAFGQEVFDVTGAGDTTIAYLGTCMVNGYTMRKSVNIANLVEGIQES